MFLRWQISILFILVVVLGCGCVPAEQEADIVIINGAEPESLDPAIATGQPDLRVVSEIFAGLLRYDPKTAEPVPDLASHYTVSEDGRVYRFFLRTNLVWASGEPITASDVVYSWLRVLRPETAGGYAGQLFYIENAKDFNNGRIDDPARVGIRALNPATVEVELEKPTPFFPCICAFPTLSVVPRSVIEKCGNKWVIQPAAASGPYRLIQWRINEKIRLKRNPAYWNSAGTSIETVDMLPVGSPATALNLYETGAADVILDKGLIPAELLDILLERDDFHEFDYLGTYFIRLNVTRRPFADPRVRRALALALDKESIVERITRAGEVAARHFVPDGMAGYSPPPGLTYDPATARRLLAAAGYPNGEGFPEFEYMFNSAAGGAAKTHQKIAVELKNMWKEELGIDVTLRQLEWKACLAAQNSLQYDACRSSWIADYIDPSTFLDLFTSWNRNNRTGWSSREYDDLIARSAQELNHERRVELLRAAETLLVCDEAPIIPLYFYKGVNAYDANRIKGIYPNLIDRHLISAMRVVRTGAGAGGAASGVSDSDEH
ncbi:MAG: peptide ABC transporter substrate-binding protein [Verrucomicrobia bacterium]|nr:peptide ABC transporter substrate-binding protein [Verrucomicrobiota bacterium]